VTPSPASSVCAMAIRAGFTVILSLRTGVGGEPHTAAVLDLFRVYVARKRAQSLLDFDDLLLGWRALLSDPHRGPAIAARWDHVLVDEYQDVNQIQVDIVRLLRPDGVGLTVVGDDAQAVYGFRGADSRHLLELSAALPAATIGGHGGDGDGDDQSGVHDRSAPKASAGGAPLRPAGWDVISRALPG
jgi:hypothetical protein